MRLAAAGFVVLAAACHDVSDFSSHGDRFEGAVVQGSFVRSGIVDGVRMCLTLDTNHLQDAPGVVSTSDGRFHTAALRPIPQIWHDPLSTLSFGDGRLSNLVYAASPTTAGVDGQDAMLFVSLMRDGNIEVRIVRGAPQGDGGPPPVTVGAAIFGVFTLNREPGTCSF